MPEREPDECGEAGREEERRVPVGRDRDRREVQPVAQVSGQRARASPDRLRDVARATGRGVDPDERERGRGGDSGHDGDAGGARPRLAEPQPEHHESREVGDRARRRPRRPGSRRSRPPGTARRQGARDGPDEGAEHQCGREQHRLDLVVHPVEAPAAVGARPDRRERVPLRLGPHHGEQEGEDGRQPEREPSARSQQDASGERERSRGEREGGDDLPRLVTPIPLSTTATTRQTGVERNAARPSDGRPRGEREQAEQSDKPDEDELRPGTRRMRVVEPVVEPPEVRERRARGARSDPRLLARGERERGRSDVADRDEPVQARRGRGQQSAIAGPDHRDRIADDVVAPARRRKGDVERRLSRAARERDLPLAARDAAVDARVAHLPAEERSESSLPADGWPCADDEEAVRGSRRREHRGRGRRDDHRHALGGRRGSGSCERRGESEPQGYNPGGPTAFKEGDSR